jgi:hypothetical protein
VHNYGPDDAERVTLDESVFIHYPTTLLSASATQGSCGNLTGRIMCELGRIRSGQSVDVQWVVTTTTEVMSVTVKSATAEDPEPSNNSASLQTLDLSGRYISVFNSLVDSGRVVSNPPGIDCANDWQTCSHYYEVDTVVTLTPIPNVGYRLVQWNGACSGSGTGPCTITITGRLRDGYINADPQFDLIDPTAITFDPSAAFDGEVGVPYTDDPVFQGGVPPYSVQVVRGSLPSGLQVSSAYGLTGIPTQRGKFTFTLQVTDRFGRSAAKAFGMNIYPALTITMTTLKNGATGKKYKAALKTAGGKKPYNWSIVGGSLPVGLTFNGATGVISGKPQQAGLYNLTVEVVDPLGGTVQKDFMLTIN